MTRTKKQKKLRAKPPSIGNETRKIIRNGKVFIATVSSQRTENRKFILDRMIGSVEKADEIIDHFQNLYGDKNFKGLTKNERISLFVDRKGCCMWCKKKLHVSNFTVEHINPIIEGGTWDWENLSIAHQECNVGRGGKFIDKQGFYKKKYSYPQLKTCKKK